MAPRSLWKGTLVVGRVAIPATLTKAAEHDDVSFKSIHRPCGTPVTQNRRCETCDVTLTGYSETVRAHEFAEGQFVEIETAQLEAALGGKQLELSMFLPASIVPPLQIATSYWLAPVEGDRHAVRAYDALLRALVKVGYAGLGSFALYSKERVALVRPLGDPPALGLQTLYLPREIRDHSAIVARLAGANSATDDEVDLFADVVKSREIPTAFRWASLERRFPRRVPELLENLVAGGKQIAVPEPAIAAPRDLVDALTKSVRGRSRRAGTRVSTGSRKSSS